MTPRMRGVRSTVQALVGILALVPPLLVALVQADVITGEQATKVGVLIGAASTFATGVVATVWNAWEEHAGKTLIGGGHPDRAVIPATLEPVDPPRPVEAPPPVPPRRRRR